MARVMVIEDEPAVSSIIRRVLARADHEVLEVATGSEAIRICEQKATDLLICDIGLPEVNGYQVAQQCRISCPNCAIILISGHLPDELERRRVPGDVEYLQKPFAPQQLLDLVNSVLNEHLSK